MSEPRSQRPHMRHWLPVFLIGVGVLIIFIVIVMGIKFDWGWTGFAGGNSQVTVKGANEEKVYLMSRTLWDWMQLLLVPVMLAAIALVFQHGNASTERKIALDKQQEDLLQAYLGHIAELLLDERLVVLDPSKESCKVAANVARVRTITVLTQLDAQRVSHVFTFLRESKLMPAPLGKILVSLKDADFHTVEWGQANLRQADLSGAKLNGAKLREADLSRADLRQADLSKADLRQADLSEADLSKADLSGAKLNGAKLNGADLSGAKLNGAVVTDEQLDQARSLQGATKPDGSICQEVTRSLKECMNDAITL